MNRSPDRRKRRVVIQAEARDEDLEGDAILDVGEFGTVEVEADRLLRALARPRNPYELRLAIDEPPDEPGAGKAINPGRRARCPDAFLEARTLVRAQCALGESRLAAGIHGRV